MKRLMDQWREVLVGVRRIHAHASVRPDHANVFRLVRGDEARVIQFEVKPVVFRVPERAHYRSADLYVALCGLLSFRRDRFETDGALLTDGFSTRVAYFRRSAKDGFVHVLGAHYDFSPNEIGHPVFHGQLADFQEFSVHVSEHYNIADEVQSGMGRILRRVRVPTAQMDVFSLVLQICADHLLAAWSSPDEKSAFERLLDRNGFCTGASYQMERLRTDEARSCYRARHWYPVAPLPAGAGD